MPKRTKGDTAGGAICIEEEPPGSIHILEIPEVPLRIIFQNLGVKDLLECRLVSKNWSVIAQAALRTRRIFIDLDKLRNISVAQGHLNEGKGKVLLANVNLLSERLQANEYFPFLGVIVSGDSWVRRRDVREFCQNFSNFFQRLYLKKVSNELAAELLGRWFPHVRDLIIKPKPGVPFGHFPFRYREAAPLALDGEKIILPSLERITIVDGRQSFVGNGRAGAYEQSELANADYSIVKRIVEAAPNLSKLDNFHFWLYPCLRTCGKLETIAHKLIIDYKYFSTRAHYVNFALNAPALTSLEICNSLPRGTGQLRQPQGWDRHRAQAETLIFAASQIILEHLAIEKLSGRLPLLTALKSLWILLDDTAGGEPYRIIDTDGAVSSYFPALETVRIFMDMVGSHVVSQYFQTRCGPCLFESVETLELLGVFDQSAFSRLRIIFPHIKRLRVHWEYFNEGNKAGLSDLWTCGWNLTELEIYGYHETWNTLPEFEAFVTGITKSELKKLRRQLNQAPVKPAEIGALRTKPSICNLTGLKTFRVFFSGSSMGIAGRSQEGTGSAVPLAVSYAFSLMPDLQTIFEYDFRAGSAKVLSEALAPYVPAVSIQHRDEEF